ncbi:hypothetical protein DFH09DRAFT_1361286 [Mycena vulgaris]|nr:hypothetical protein DFH09DRAFT_1361286 [Mycena vulgaris]
MVQGEFPAGENMENQLELSFSPRCEVAATVKDLLKINRFDLPSNIERNPADYAKLIAVVREALTQMRSKIKKGLAASFKVNKEPAPSVREHQNIFELTTHLVHGTKCAVTPELSIISSSTPSYFYTPQDPAGTTRHDLSPPADYPFLRHRVALMRQVYIEDSGTKFWDSLDADLRKIRNRAGGNARKLNKAFENVLSTDRATHGVDDYGIPSDNADEVQREVDDAISAAAADKAATIPAAATGDPDAED